MKFPTGGKGPFPKPASFLLIWCDSKANGTVRMKEMVAYIPCIFCALIAVRALFLWNSPVQEEFIMEKQSRDKILKMVQMAMLIAISLVLIMLIRFPLFPSAAFLQYDMADVPVLVGTLLFGPLSGLLILLIEAFLQAFLLGGDGWVGFLMHFIASGALVLIAGLFYKKWHSVKGIAVGLIIGSIGATLLMIPLNYIFTVHFYGVPLDAVNQLMLPAIIPFNIIKAGVNSVITAGVYLPLNRYLVRRRKPAVDKQNQL